MNILPMVALSKKLAIFCGFVVLIVSGVGCAHRGVKVPEGFAKFHQMPGPQVRAVDPEGVLFRVRTEKQKQEAHISYWRQALRLRMEQSGYLTRDSISIKVDGIDGAAYEFIVPQGNSDQIYLIAFVPRGRRIVVFEASGDVEQFSNSKSEILEAIVNSRL